jgi:hypothetical protein
MLEEQTSRLLETIEIYASNLGINLKDYETHIVQREKDSLGVAYLPHDAGNDIILISCNDSPSGPKIVGQVSGSEYAMRKIFRKLGINIPARSIET